MRIVHQILEESINFEENIINVLIIENQNLFSKLIEEMLNQIKGEEGRYILSINDEKEELPKFLELIIDPFSLDFNNKKIVSKLYKNIKEIAIGEENFFNTAELTTNIIKYLEKLFEDIDFPIAYSSEMDIEQLLKIFSVKFDVDYQNILEKLVEYITLMDNLEKNQLYVFVNLKTYLTDEEIGEFYKFIFYNKINVLLIENFKRGENLKEEKIYLIDKDLCRIS